MDYDVIYLIGTVIFTIGGWELGKRIWKAKGADPGRGKWYGAILGFLLGVIGIITLLGISWRWHPASEPVEQRPWAPAGRSRVGGAVLLGITSSVAIAATVVALILLLDTAKYAQWAGAMTDTGTPVTRAECSQVTSDWGTCYVHRAAARSDSEWKSIWSAQAQDGALLSGIAVVIGVACWTTAIYAWRRRTRVIAAESAPAAVGSTDFFAARDDITGPEGPSHSHGGSYRQLP